MNWPISSFVGASLVAWSLLVVGAARRRGRRVATVISIAGGLQILAAAAIVPLLKMPIPIAIALELALFTPFLVPPKNGLRSRWFYNLVSLPAAWWLAGTFLALPWALSSAIGYPLGFAWIPFVVAALGFRDSLSMAEDVVDVVLDGEVTADVPKRHRSPPAPRAPESRPLRVIQITDPHLGSFMSERRLRGICERAVARNPDLIVLTGDFLTIDSNSDEHALRRALEPLRAATGRTFACLGNHDYEALPIVKDALAQNGVRLLVDESTVVETPAGTVQILGIDFRWQGRAEHLAEVCAAHPRQSDALRLVLLHDPSAFQHVPVGDGDLVLSGHTHGGQLGLLRFGLPHTILSLLTPIPDHGLWARGRDRLYVHRGTGHYGFPLRIGVPSEHSLLQIHRAPSTFGA